MSKYRNKPTTRDGISFDSIKEADKYDELKLRMKVDGSDGVKCFAVHERFVILDAFINNEGKKIKPMYYESDFTVTYKDDRKEIIDIKPYDIYKQEFYLTDVFKMKRKLFWKRYPQLVLRLE